MYVLSSTVVVQEKVDGLNIGFYLDPDDRILVIQKDRLLRPEEICRLPQVGEWCAHHESRLRKLLGRRFALFGEYVPGIRLPQGFTFPWVVFDCYDFVARRFLSWENVQRFAHDLQVLCVPSLFVGIVDGLQNLLRLLGPSRLYDGPIEGLCIRVEEGGFLKERYKFVRPGYEKRKCRDPLIAY